CYIGREALARIDQRLAREGLALAELLPVLVRGRLEVRFGRVQLQLEELDPAYTVGKTRLSLEQAYAKLDREGLARRQAALPWPELPLRVGLVAGADGEGTRDFRRTLEESGLPFSLRLEAVRMQGEGLEAALVGALERLAAADVDVIAIVRGGGAGADLHGFNAPGLARAVCTCPRPVLIGIGHDHDRTLLDLVARSQRTPTAAGRHLVDTVAAAVQARELRLRDAFGRLAARLSTDRARLDGAGRALGAVPALLARRADALAATRARVEHRWRAVAAEASRQLDVGATQLRAVPERLRTEGLRLEGAARDLARAPGVRLQRDRRALDARAEGLARLATRRMEAARLTLARRPVLLEGRATLLTERAAQGIALRAERLAARDPARLLARGYALVTRPGGGLVRGAGELAAGEALRLRMADGTVDVRVEQAREDQGGG
ncbi:MAG: exodeoxyribonuclease VII large subunit, partial [Candidatus Sericytochromatia bacterium]|nr:exodeoxyribonuclease VII large subunit [Candidatus Sericytochromatia bacterium]